MKLSRNLLEIKCVYMSNIAFIIFTAHVEVGKPSVQLVPANDKE